MFLRLRADISAFASSLRTYLFRNLHLRVSASKFASCSGVKMLMAEIHVRPQLAVLTPSPRRRVHDARPPFLLFLHLLSVFPPRSLSFCLVIFGFSHSPSLSLFSVSLYLSLSFSPFPSLCPSISLQALNLLDVYFLLKQMPNKDAGVKEYLVTAPTRQERLFARHAQQLGRAWQP